MIKTRKWLLLGGMVILVSVALVLTVLNNLDSDVVSRGVGGHAIQAAPDRSPLPSPSVRPSRNREASLVDTLVEEADVKEIEVGDSLGQQNLDPVKLTLEDNDPGDFSLGDRNSPDLAVGEINLPEDSQEVDIDQLARRERDGQEVERREMERRKLREQEIIDQLLAQQRRVVRSRTGRPGVLYQRVDRHGATPRSEESRFTPIRSLYNLNSRGYENDALSGLIVQAQLVKKDRRLKWQQHDIDDCNSMVLAYVQRGVRENKNYFLRRKLVETFGQTNHTVLINRMRLVAVLLGSERGSGGMDPRFRSIREEAHRISPYVIVQVEEYISDLEEKMKRARIDPGVDKQFKNYVDALGESHESEYGVADVGARNRNQPAKELYALKVLLRDLKEYYGERVEEKSDTQRYEVVFSYPGTFQSDTLTKLKRRYSGMRPNELSKEFIKLGLELREHLSALRENRNTPRRRHDDEEINHLKKLNEIAASVTGLFGASRLKQDPKTQAKTLVDLLFLEGLYSRKERARLLKELDVELEFGSGHEKEIRAFHAFLSYMHGLAYATMDEALGDAARAFTKYTETAENYLEIEARKSALQVLGQLQLEFYDKNKKTLAGKKDIHLAGTALGRLKVFRSESEITRFLREDSRNGADTIWVLKSGLKMPNEASFAAIVLEDPIMKASHYDGYARSRNPPIPLMQIPDATKAYAKFNNKNVRLKASRSPENVEIKVTSAAGVGKSVTANKKHRLPHKKGRPGLFEIDSAKSNGEIREMQKHCGSKAANYAFLRSALPLDKAKNKEHIYPGFAIPFHFYQRHLASSGADRAIAGLESVKDPQSVNVVLSAIRGRILKGAVEESLLALFEKQMNDRFKARHGDQAGEIKLRFRSSSNAEDNKDFSGAGLYESHSAYYIYGNDSSALRDARARNRLNVKTAIKKVWASLWNAEAYQARERAGIAQETVRMGVLVHPSYRKEESTGVVYRHAPDDIEIVVNKGNVNVQNPSIAGLTPEMHRIKDDTHHIDHSSRYILSEREILSSNDRDQLMGLLDQVVPKFRELYPDEKISGVDVEFKVLEVPDEEGGERDVVMLKQIRPLAKREQ